jgi:hypothetical protein
MTNFDDIIQDIEDRKTALFEIERALFTERYNLSKKHKDIFSIQSISMIYSLWEGFVQKSFQFYIDELNKCNADIFNFSNDIIIHHTENTFKQFSNYPQNPNRKIKFFDELLGFYSLKKHTINRVINTESNVSFEILNKLLMKFSLEPFPEFWKTYVYPNPNLKETMLQFLKLRNTVAHGGDIDSEEKVTHVTYERYKNLIIDLMYEIHQKMINGIINYTYKSNNSIKNKQQINIHD